MTIRTQFTRLAAVACAASITAACGYALAGRGNALPATVRTIGVPQFVNQAATAPPELDRVLTDGVRAEFQSKGRYRVEPDANGVNAVMTATITNVALQPSAFTETRQVSSYSVIVTANVEFKEVPSNNVLWSNPSFSVSDEFEVSPTNESSTDTTTFFSRVSDAQDRLARKFAREVVTSIFEAF